MKNPFSDERANDEFVAATKDAKLREKRIEKLCRARKLLLWIFASQCAFAYLLLYPSGTHLNTGIISFAMGLSVMVTIFHLATIDLQIKFLKAARG